MEGLCLGAKTKAGLQKKKEKKAKKGGGENRKKESRETVELRLPRHVNTRH